MSYFTKSNMILASDRFLVKKKREAPIDKEISKILGKEVRTTDPRLIKAVVEHKKALNKPDTDLSRDDMLYDQRFIKRLKKAFE